MYGSEQGLEIPLNLSIFNLQVEEKGNYDLTASLVYDGIVILTTSTRIKIKECEPNWKQHNTSCQQDDSQIAYYKDSKRCYEKTGQSKYLEGRPENATSYCDYCTPNWIVKNTSCYSDDTKVVYYVDKKECYEKTGLASDIVGRPENITIECDYCTPQWKPHNTSCQKDNTLIRYYKDSDKCYEKTNLDSDLIGKPENETLECNKCILNLTQYNTTCAADDTFVSYYIDSKKCYEKTGLEEDKVPDNITSYCDYCTPFWTAVNTSCLKGDIIVEWYNDFNECYKKTALASDSQGMPENKTYKDVCSFYRNNLIGDTSSINTTIKTLAIFVADSSNLTQVFNDVQKVSIKENESKLLEFNFNFSAYELRLADLAIQKQGENASKGFVIVKNLYLAAQNSTKTIWIDKITNGAGVCVKDEEGDSISSISPRCNGTNEVFVRCPGNMAGYACEIDAGKYKVSGLRHSIIAEQEAFCGDDVCNGDESCNSCSDDCGGCPVSASQGGGSSTSGGGGCTPQWECSEWSACSEEKQIRKCTNLKEYCPINKPKEEQECEVPPEIVNSGEALSPESPSGIRTEWPQTKNSMIGRITDSINILPIEAKASIIISLILDIISIIVFLVLVRGKNKLSKKGKLSK